LIDAYQEGLLAKSEFEPRVRATRERLAKLETEAEAARDQEAEGQQLEAVIGHLEGFAQRVECQLRDADWVIRREILRALVKQVEIGEETIRVVYKVPPHPFVEGPAGGRSQDRLGGELTVAGQHRLARARGTGPAAIPRTRGEGGAAVHR